MRKRFHKKQHNRGKKHSFKRKTKKLRKYKVSRGGIRL